MEAIEAVYPVRQPPPAPPPRSLRFLSSTRQTSLERLQETLTFDKDLLARVFQHYSQRAEKLVWPVALTFPHLTHQSLPTRGGRT